MLSKRTAEQSTYLLINLSFFAVIVFVFLYSLIFRANNHPIPALLTEVTGHIPPSKGLSSSFSEIVRGNFDLAYEYNTYGLRIFSFFAIQFLMRIFFSLLIHMKPVRINAIAIIDIIVSILLFVICFAPLITYTLRMFFP